MLYYDIFSEKSPKFFRELCLKNGKTTRYGNKKESASRTSCVREALVISIVITAAAGKIRFDARDQ